MIPENLSSEVVGHFYAMYARPWEQKWTTRIREMGKHSFIHMDGTLALLDQVADAGFDIIEAFTPAPVGDASIHEVRAMAGSSPILWGGLPGVYFTSLVSDQEFDRHVREVLEVMVEDKRMVLGVADQVPPDALRRRVARVVKLVERYGRYV
jgi:uroporphyrinogen-III decarboxylase